MTAAPNDLARALRAFFADHLPRVRGTSPHTIRSYRDSLVLLLRFVATRSQRSVIQIDLDDLGPQPVLAFLQHLELDRRNSVATRNVRLAATRARTRSRGGSPAGRSNGRPPRRSPGRGRPGGGGGAPSRRKAATRNAPRRNRPARAPPGPRRGPNERQRPRPRHLVEPTTSPHPPWSRHPRQPSDDPLTHPGARAQPEPTLPGIPFA